MDVTRFLVFVFIVRTPYRPDLIHPFASAIDEPELVVPDVMVKPASSLLPHVQLFICFHSDGGKDGLQTRLGPAPRG